MILTLIPQWGRGEAAYIVDGDVLTINGTPYDLSAIPEGGEGTHTPAPGEDHIFIGPITREGGIIHATLHCWVGEDAPYEQPDAPWVVDVANGPVTIPAIRIEQEAPE